MPRLLSRDEIESAFSRLGELAVQIGERFEFIVVGGSAMVLGYNARNSTKDVDYAPLPSLNSAQLRRLASQVATERNWDPDWLNDGAKGYLTGEMDVVAVFDRPGIHVVRPSTTQLLAMKLTAWRDDVDINDAMLLLQHLNADTLDAAWDEIEQFILSPFRMKVRYALEDLWQRR